MKRKVSIAVWIALGGIVLGNLLSAVQAEAQQRRVGKFTLASSVRVPTLAQQMGALDARRDLYVAPDGVQVQYQVIVLSSASDANAYVQNEVSRGVGEGASLRYNNHLSAPDGRTIGEIVLLQKGDGEAAIWTIEYSTSQLLAIGLGPQGYVWDFVQSLFGYSIPSQPLPSAGNPGGIARGSGDPGRCQRCLAEDRRRFDECMEQARQYRKEHLEGDKSGSLVLHSLMVGSCSSSPDVCSEECGHIGR